MISCFLGTLSTRKLISMASEAKGSVSSLGVSGGVPHGCLGRVRLYCGVCFGEQLVLSIGDSEDSHRSGTIE
jgi:hypothetical protein